MNLAGLSFNALPSIDLPFRYFITAPVFMFACAALVFYSGDILWVSRWHPHMLALTHGFTLGFLTMVMMGALLQLLPVIGGIGLPFARQVASFSHAFLIIGTVFLMLGFILNKDWMFAIALIALVLSIGVYLAALAWVLKKKLSQGDSIIGFRLAVISLFIVLLLGLALISRNLGINTYLLSLDLPIDLSLDLPLIPAGEVLTNIHGLWGLIGWAGLLIIAVSFQVIPMFHVAPSFPQIIRRYLIPVIFTLLIVFIFLPSLALPLLMISQGIFAICLLLTIAKRKRKVADTSIRYWQLGAVSLVVINTLYFIPSDIWSLYCVQEQGFVLTAIFVYFYLLSIIQGMLLKILPFLSYTHLQQACLTNFSAMQYIPHMHEFMNKKQASWLYYLHLFSGLSLLLVLVQPVYYQGFATLLVIESCGLLFLMPKTIRLYYITQHKMKTAAANT